MLDHRLPTEQIRDVGDYSVQPENIIFDKEVAEYLAQELIRQPGLERRRRREGNDVPSQEEWDSLARHLFGLPGDLCDWQKSYLEEIMLGGHRTLVIKAPTGSGKSLIFQFPALVQSMKTGLLTMVVSPLRALMHEQCQRLWEQGFAFTVEAVSGDLSSDEVDEVYQRLAGGQLQLLFVAPERFRSRRFVKSLGERLHRDQRLQYWIFDEAHCISLWGHEFRPDYFYAAQEAQRLRSLGSDEKAPVLLLSATLPEQVVRELEEIFEGGHAPS